MNPRFQEVGKILNDYITTHNKEFDVYFIKCDFYLVVKYLVVKYLVVKL